ncbi:MAG TPA: hypothetical protein VG722_13100, partial [Tepidisphaeraceae bacterium]|nr:hypothetical protein [Tepidisphaeraceae bacterium]
GLIGLPELARPTAKYQYFYLNGRTIRDRIVQHALREAYRGLTEPGRQPAGILLIQMPPEDVDVNVHPTKAEVRFKNSQRIHGLVLSAVREKLLGSDLTPHAVAKTDAPPTEERRHLQEQLAAFFKQPPAVTAPPAPASAWETNSTAGNQRPPEFVTRSIPAAPEPPRIAPPPTSAPAIQLHNAYLVAESDDGLIIIDQHALHERIMYEELHERLSRGPLESQRLLLPATISASARQIDLLEQIKPLLERLGIELAPIGPTAIAVHSFPSFLSKLDPSDFVAELLERGEQEMLDLTQEEMLHEVLDMMACKAAVKAGDPLSPAEIEALLAKRGLVERSSNCPHGRPTTLRLSLRDLEKQFKRTGF